MTMGVKLWKTNDKKQKHIVEKIETKISHEPLLRAS